MTFNLSFLTSKTLSISFVASFFLTHSLFAFSSENYTKTPHSLEASALLPKSIIEGVNYEIDNDVANDGLINLYTIHSDYGSVEAEGTVELHMRLAEFRAISAMEEMDRGDIFGEALGEGLKAPVKGVVALAKEPVNTTKAAAKGLGQFVSNIGRAFVSDDPDQDNALAVMVGYDVAKRQFAYELDINPYTDNELVRDYLGKISRAAVAGGLTPRAAMAAIDSTAITVARVTGATQGMKKLIRDNPPGKLDKINREKLLAMGVSEGLAESFLDNYHFDPYDETILVGELEVMDGVDGREKFIQVANKAEEDSVARYYRAMAQMFGAYHTYVGKAKAIHSTGGTAHIIDKNGKLIILSPVDYVFWTKRLEDWFNKFTSEISQTTKKEVWVAGRFDKHVRAQFEKNGWKIIENAEDVLLKNL